jgi:hypothetical protein
MSPPVVKRLVDKVRAPQATVSYIGLLARRLVCIEIILIHFGQSDISIVGHSDTVLDHQ